MVKVALKKEITEVKWHCEANTAGSKQIRHPKHRRASKRVQIPGLGTQIFRATRSKRCAATGILHSERSSCRAPPGPALRPGRASPLGAPRCATSGGCNPTGRRSGCQPPEANTRQCNALRSSKDCARHFVERRITNLEYYNCRTWHQQNDAGNMESIAHEGACTPR